MTIEPLEEWAARLIFEKDPNVEPLLLLFMNDTENPHDRRAFFVGGSIQTGMIRIYVVGPDFKGNPLFQVPFADYVDFAQSVLDFGRKFSNRYNQRHVELEKVFSQYGPPKPIMN